MYCKRCTAKLPTPPEDPALAAGPWLGGKPGEIPYQSPQLKSPRCPVCRRKYDPKDPRTYRQTLALPLREIVTKVVLTTALGIAATYVVAFHQMAQASGH